jgi:hypothetical protein
VKLETTKGISFAFHVDDGNIVVDEAHGCTTEEGMSMFPPWMLEDMEQKENP